MVVICNGRGSYFKWRGDEGDTVCIFSVLEEWRAHEETTAQNTGFVFRRRFGACRPFCSGGVAGNFVDDG